MPVQALIAKSNRIIREGPGEVPIHTHKPPAYVPGEPIPTFPETHILVLAWGPDHRLHAELFHRAALGELTGAAKGWGDGD